jgi:succinate-semialdehyde dehydrogenase / glutarate-semialdehyde dehydrogenase
MLDAGLAPGVLNVVTTSRAGDVVSPLLRDERLQKLSFTGSTTVGRQLLRHSADRVLRTSMELGGNASAFAERLAVRMDALVIGPGTEPGVEAGPLIDAAQRDKVAALVDDGRAGGADVLCGGTTVDGPGYFYRPTVLVDPAPAAAILRDEIFGPIAPIVTFADDADAIAMANATEYGLVAYLYTRDLDRGLRSMERLETGMVGINRGVVSNAAAPFGGMKASGLGREGGREGIEEYLETKYASIGL